MQCNAPQDREVPVHETWLATLGKFTDNAMLLSHVRANRCLRREVNPAERHAQLDGKANAPQGREATSLLK